MNHPILKDFKEVLETNFVTFYLNQLGDTLISKLKESTHITIEIAKETIATVSPIKDAGSKYAIFDSTATFLSISDEGKRHFKENKSSQYKACCDCSK